MNSCGMSNLQPDYRERSDPYGLKSDKTRHSASEDTHNAAPKGFLNQDLASTAL